MQDIGFVHYWWRHDYRAAADWFGRGEHGGWRAVVAAIACRGDACRGWRPAIVADDVGVIRQSAEIDWLRQEATKRLLQLQALDEIDTLQKAVDNVATTTGQRPVDWLALVRSGVLRGIPQDPSATPYEIDAEGHVRLAPTSPLFPLPDEPKARGRPALMSGWATTFLAALIGAVVGSFLNVCIYRLPRRASLMWPGSACPACQRPLAWFENLPILSFIALRGRCRTCRAPISSRYPVVEAVTAVMFAVAWWYFGATPLLVSRLVFGCALIVLFAIDLEHHLLPNVITLPGIVIGFIFSFFTEPGWLSSLVASWWVEVCCT
jgi:hypothetical protein